MDRLHQAFGLIDAAIIIIDDHEGEEGEKFTPTLFDQLDEAVEGAARAVRKVRDLLKRLHEEEQQPL